MRHVLVVAGTRPEVVKLAPVVRELRARPRDFRVTFCSTGQHREMLDATLDAFDLRADLDLGLMQAAQHPSDLAGRLMIALGGVLSEHKPDVVVVQGDTTTVMASSIAATLHKVRVAHVEAGLRTGDITSPFPEEINRRVAGAVADIHFAPTAAARSALLSEGVCPEAIVVTGNTVIDALHWMAQRVKSTPLPEPLAGDGRLVLVTAHRRESFGEPFREMCLAMKEIADRFPDVRLVYPVHLNPSVQQPVREILSDCPRVHLVEPLDYAHFVQLMTRAYLILTDSGGIQEEAPALGKPTLVMRDKTERPEAVAAGVVRLVGSSRQKIVDEASRLLSDPAAYKGMARVVEVYGDGFASRRIAEVLADHPERTPEFLPPVL
ncbi:MAG: UDP-N-acetylglucosamine 2-epimerase (non-hydrolyzing) [Phycisphaerales bacterium]|nr:UDP-N-acetylglucosamine 2-epimerase (non-hydrolyzing) [Phycisphaerales bacterium]